MAFLPNPIVTTYLSRRCPIHHFRRSKTHVHV